MDWLLSWQCQKSLRLHYSCKNCTETLKLRRMSGLAIESINSVCKGANIAGDQIEMFMEPAQVCYVKDTWR